MKYRIEKDSIGERQVPAEVYYGIQTLRSKENFQITKQGICRQLIKSLVIIKKAAAKANWDAGILDEKIAKAIMLACDEILNGRLHGQFVTDLIQGGAGTSMNMNANEVIANRANEMLGAEKGSYEFVHPLDHVNMGQSTNDVIPTAAKLAFIKQLKKLLVELKKLQSAYDSKAVEFNDVIKMGRTHLQEAVPIRLGQEFNAFSSLLGRDIKRVENAIDNLSEVNMGATAVGTGLNANGKYVKKVVTYINKFSGEEMHSAKDLVDSTRHLDNFLWTSSVLKTLAVGLSKTASDLRLMASTGMSGFKEINLPVVQPGSSIMPGKFNPVIPEMVNQVAFYVIGLDVTVTKAVEAGQLELNVFEPIIMMSIFQEITYIRRAARTFRELAIEGITVNSDACKYTVEHSSSVVTALSPHLGYDTACSIVKESLTTRKTVHDIVLERGLMEEDLLNEVLNIENMVTPGIKGEEKLHKKEE